MRHNHPRKMNPLARAVLLQAVPPAPADQPTPEETAAMQTAIREAALRIPMKEAMRQLALRLTSDLDAALKDALEARLGEPLTDPSVLGDRFTAHPDPEDVLEGERGVVYALDGEPLLWAGPVRLERIDDPDGSHRLAGDRALKVFKPRGEGA